MKHEETKNIAALSFTAWNGLYITDIDSDSVTVRYGYQSSDGMVYDRRVTRPLDYDHKPDWSDEDIPSFTYHGNRYFVDEFIRL